MEQKQPYIVRAFNSVVRTLDRGLDILVDGVFFVDKRLDRFTRLSLEPIKSYSDGDNCADFYIKTRTTLKSKETDGRIVI